MIVALARTLTLLVLAVPGLLAAQGPQILTKLDVTVSRKTLLASVRWSDSAGLAYGGSMKGLWRIHVKADGLGLEQITHGYATHVAFDGDRFAFGTRLTGLTWAGFEGQPMTLLALDSVLDFDLQDGRAAILGGHRNPEETGYRRQLGWLGDYGAAAIDDLRPFIQQPLEPPEQVQRVSRCDWIANGVIRYLPDGSILVVPGVMPGVFWYSPTGTLQRSWRTEDLQIADSCEGVEGGPQPFRTDMVARYRWINRFALVDAILPFPNTPALARRIFNEGSVSWDLVFLLPDGDTLVRSLPLTSDAPEARLDGDVLAGNAIFVISALESAREEPPASRLVVMEIEAISVPTAP